MATTQPFTAAQLARLERLHTAIADLLIEADAFDSDLARDGNEQHVGVGIVASHLGCAASYLTKWRNDWNLYPAATTATQSREGASI